MRVRIRNRVSMHNNVIDISTLRSSNEQLLTVSLMYCGHSARSWQGDTQVKLELEMAGMAYIYRETFQVMSQRCPRVESSSWSGPGTTKLVQGFVPNGSRMWTCMNQVGNLYSKNAAFRVFAVGEKLLDTLTCWTDRRRRLRTLACLKQTQKQEMEGNG